VPVEDIPGLMADAVAAFEARHGTKPVVAVVPGVGLFATGDTTAQAGTARDVYLDMVRTGATALRLGGVRCLDDRERRFIETGEAESYRKQVAAAG
jgi:rhamnulokinase